MSTPALHGASGCDPQAVAEFLRALAHPMRLSILCRLLEGECAVSGFETELGLKQPNLSQQLAMLREAGLVATRRESKSMVYRLADERVQTVMAALKSAFGAGTAVTGEMVKPPTASPPSARPHAPPLAQTASAVRMATPAGAECGVFSTAGWPVS